MIKKILNKLFSQKIDDEHLECAIDEDTVDCGHLDDDQISTLATREKLVLLPTTSRLVLP